MKFLFTIFFCAFFNCLFMAQSAPSNSKNKGEAEKSFNLMGWFKKNRPVNGKEKSLEEKATEMGKGKPSVEHESPPPIRKMDPPKKCDLKGRMDYLLCSSEEADVYFLVREGDDNELFPAHKMLLWPASPVFEAMFLSNEQKTPKQEGTADNPIIVPDIGIKTFHLMLRFIYSDDFSEVNADNLFAVLFAANKYQVIGLIDACAAFPISKMNNVFLALAEAHFLSVEELVRRCLAYIGQNAMVLLQSDEFLQIEQNILSLLLESDQLEIENEITIWNAALRWADNQCRKNGKAITGANRRQMLGPALFKIRFPNIPHQHFTKEIVSTGVLSKAEVISVYLFHSLSGQNLPANFPLPFPAQSDDCGRFRRSGTLIFDRIKSISAGQSRYSNSISIMGIQCKIMLSREDGYCAFYLICEPEKNYPNWHFSCVAKFQSIQQQYSRLNQTKEAKRFDFNAKATKFGYNEFFNLNYGDDVPVRFEIEITKGTVAGFGQSNE